MFLPPGQLHAVCSAVAVRVSFRRPHTTSGATQTFVPTLRKRSNLDVHRRTSRSTNVQRRSCRTRGNRRVLAHNCPQTVAENEKDSSRISPETASDLVFLFVAGAGYEPATSGLDRRLADRYRTLRDAAGSSVLMRRTPR